MLILLPGSSCKAPWNTFLILEYIAISNLEKSSRKSSPRWRRPFCVKLFKKNSLFSKLWISDICAQCQQLSKNESPFLRASQKRRPSENVSVTSASSIVKASLLQAVPVLISGAFSKGVPKPGATFVSVSSPLATSAWLRSAILATQPLPTSSGKTNTLSNLTSPWHTFRRWRACSPFATPWQSFTQSRVE